MKSVNRLRLNIGYGCETLLVVVSLLLYHICLIARRLGHFRALQRLLMIYWLRIIVFVKPWVVKCLSSTQSRVWSHLEQALEKVQRLIVNVRNQDAEILRYE